MRFVLTIILLFNFVQTVSAQSTDTTKRDTIILSPVIFNSSNQYKFDSLGIYFTSSSSSGTQFIIPTVPTCSCLKLKDGKYYLENDTIQYKGTCVVTDINSPSKLAVIGDVSDYYFGINRKNILCFSPDYIKIISRYTDGKRNGNREYYDKSGKLIKTEVYDNGVLIKTTYP